MSKPRQPSLLLSLAKAAHKAGSPPSTVVVLWAVSHVEEEIGLSAVLNGLLTAYTSITTTLAANGAMPMDDAVAAITDKLDHLREVRDALASGQPLPDTKAFETQIDEGAAMAWGGKPGGRA